jgi:hypothetical protein
MGLPAFTTAGDSSTFFVCGAVAASRLPDGEVNSPLH